MVASLLKTARDAHSRYRSASGRIGTGGRIVQAPDLLICGEAVRTALAARLDAHARDPQHTDLAWLEDTQAMKGATSDSLIEFYGAYLGRAQAV